MTALLLWTFVLTFVNVLRDLVPAVTLFPSFIYAFGCFSIVVFLLSVPPSAVVVILARVHFSTDRMPCVNPHEAEFRVRLGRFRGAGRFCDQPSDTMRKP
jgi:hypothetical protein